MKELKRYIFLFAIFMVTFGCVHPSSQVRTIDDRPILVISGAPQAAVLYVDGIEMGLATNFDGDKNALRLKPGTHSVRVADSGRDYLNRQVYLGSGSIKTLTISGVSK